MKYMKIDISTGYVILQASVPQTFVSCWQKEKKKKKAKAKTKQTNDIFPILSVFFVAVYDTLNAYMSDHPHLPYEPTLSLQTTH